MLIKTEIFKIIAFQAIKIFFVIIVIKFTVQIIISAIGTNTVDVYPGSGFGDRRSGRVQTLVPADAILGSNTSSLSVTEIAGATSDPSRVIGLHFFNPVPVMKLVEVVRTLLTSDAAFEAAFDFARKVGKEPVAARDKAVLTLLYGGGLRISEALGLKRRDIDGRDTLTVIGKGCTMVSSRSHSRKACQVSSRIGRISFVSRGRGAPGAWRRGPLRRRRR